jgi:hypothetical protein
MYLPTKDATMRLLDQKSEKALESVTVYLTQSEAEELRDSVIALLREPHHAHYHINSNDFKKELTICIYNENDLSGFGEIATGTQLVMTRWRGKTVRRGD